MADCYLGERTKRRRIRTLVQRHLQDISEELQGEQSEHSVNEVLAINSTACPDKDNNENEGHPGDDDVIDTEEDGFCDTGPEMDFTDPESSSEDFVSEPEEECHSDEENTSLTEQLAEWATVNNVPTGTLSSLLSILSQTDLKLPRDPRTLLSTPRQTCVKECAGGTYYYFGLRDSLLPLLEDFIHPDVNVLNLQVNVDGVPLFKSSNVSLWPILGRIHEYPRLPPFVIAVFCGSSKPTELREFLKDFVQEMKDVLVRGIKHKDRSYIVQLHAVICDAPARAYIKCVKSHNGYSSCERCVQTGVYTNNRMTFPELHSRPRTDQDFISQRDEDHHTGLSPLAGLGIGMVSVFPLDYMHLVCLGVVRRLLLLWLKGPLRCRMSGNIEREVSHSLTSLRNCIPREFSRKPRSLIEVKRWKATEFRQFLLYSGPVVLCGKLKNELYRHFLVLSVAMFILLSPTLCQQFCEYAGELLTSFCGNVGVYYGREFLVYNVHNLIHLKDDVRRYGSLDNVSAFPFENFLGSLKKMVRRPQNPVSQIIRRIHEQRSAQSVHSEDASHSFKQPHFCGPLPSLSNVEDCQQFPVSSSEELDAFDERLQDETFKKGLVVFLGDIGGRTLEETVKRIMAHVMSDEFATSCNISGRNKKTAFGKMLLFDVVYRAVKRNPKSSTSTRKDVEAAIAKWLIGSRDRCGARRGRLGGVEATTTVSNVEEN